MAKQSIACTLFEGDYHMGAGVLINSLSAKGFNGILCAGYRGRLPEWAAERAQPEPALGADRVRINDQFDALFFKVSTSRNLTNFKPEFMLEVWNKLPHQADFVFFFDADIFISAPWSFFEEWAEAGLALVADGNSPMPVNHPTRVAWRQHYEPHGFQFSKSTDYHFNGGFIGVSRARIWALEAWAKIQTLMEESVRLDLPITLIGAPEWQRNRTFKFFLTDQDALNIVADLHNLEVSAMGSEGMGWKQPVVYMEHALGGKKPWRQRYLLNALKGEPPSRLDFAYWRLAAAPIRLAEESALKRTRITLAVAQRLARWGQLLTLLRPF